VARLHRDALHNHRVMDARYGLSTARWLVRLPRVDGESQQSGALQTACMTDPSTTIRVRLDQRDRVRELAEQRSSSMTDTLDAALESLRRELFYREMADSEAALRARPDEWARYTAERNAWLSADLG
jgi:hypothetical protein